MKGTRREPKLTSPKTKKSHAHGTKQKDKIEN